MGITYPRPMIDDWIMDCPFEIERVDLLSPEAGGRLGAVSAGFPLWHMKLTLQNMTLAEGDLWRAWVDSLRGAQRRFFAHDVKRPVPRFHASGVPFTRSTDSWSHTIDEDGNATLALNGMMTGMVLSYGDYIGFEWGAAGRSLVRVVQGGSTGADHSLSVIVEPPVPSLTPSDATANLYKPSCLMRLVKNETQIMPAALGLFVPAGSTVGGIQDLIE